MKEFLKTLTLSVLLSGFGSCQSKPVQTIFETTQNDSATHIHEAKSYILKKHTTNSDFNYLKLDNIDANIKGALNLKNLMPIFSPISGRYNYYQFVATFKGKKYIAPGDKGERIGTFHDIIIIKTDGNNKIIDAYHYTIEWGEVPRQYDLYKSSFKYAALTNNLDINQLKFIRTYGRDDNNKELKENGFIKLN